MEYQTLKERSGISDFMLEAICRDFLDKYDRFPYLDEIIGSNSDPYLRKVLQIDIYNGTSIQNLLSVTGTDTVEDANIVLNDQYRDVEVEITPLNKDAIVEITKRPTEDNFDNWTEENEILARAPRNAEGQLLAPNGKVSNLTEKQYAQVRTKAFKRWFGDWENNPANASKVVDENGEPLVVYHGSKNDWTEYDKDRFKKDQFGRGIYLSEDKRNAEQYGKVMELFVNSRQPFYAGFIWENGKRAIKPQVAGYLFNHDTIDKKDYVQELKKLINEEDAKVLGTELSSADSVVISYKNPYAKYGEIVVSDPTQIKSATDNSGLFNRQSNNIYDPEPNGYLVFTNALNKLASLYGIKFNDITDAELNSEKWKSIIPDVNSVNAFVYNGQIYINIDKANLDAPIHEMMHILIGSMRFTNPSMYQDLINLVQKFPNYQKLVQQYPNRSRNDVNEEIFITEVSRYIAGLPSNISGIDYKLQYEISYNIKRVLDSILMGQDSVKTLSNDRLFNLSLKQIAKEINSSIMTNNFRGTLDVEGSELHRKLNNIKADLIEQKLLKEDCD